ncbi:hypothetical protein GQ607_009380 [Colletotrichum asianum]|uniref:Uncharacterized protein n=1 Tax=Colletotrichum asianum TaxID=702518 RepID=A0A8H3ZL94_9PEZI|nr:hypothetical protein GQ607_009380 [Colletotrichum asianum]
MKLSRTGVRRQHFARRPFLGRHKTRGRKTPGTKPHPLKPHTIGPRPGTPDPPPSQCGLSTGGTAPAPSMLTYTSVQFPPVERNAIATSCTSPRKVHVQSTAVPIGPGTRPYQLSQSTKSNWKASCSSRCSGPQKAEMVHGDSRGD